MLNIQILYQQKVHKIQISPKISIYDFKEYLIGQFKLKDQAKISAKIYLTNQEIDLEKDDQTKLLDKYNLQNEETIILTLLYKRQSLIGKAMQQNLDILNGLQPPGSQRVNQFPRACKDCQAHKEELKQKQQEIEKLRQQISSYTTIRQQHDVQESERLNTQDLSQGFQTQSVFCRTQAESLQGTLLMQDLEKMTKQLFLNEIENLKQRIEEKNIETKQLKGHYEIFMKDRIDQIDSLKLLYAQDKEAQKQIYQSRIEDQQNEIKRLKDQIQAQQDRINTLNDVVKKFLV